VSGIHCCQLVTAMATEDQTRRNFIIKSAAIAAIGAATATVPSVAAPSRETTPPTSPVHPPSDTSTRSMNNDRFSQHGSHGARFPITYPLQLFSTHNSPEQLLIEQPHRVIRGTIFQTLEVVQQMILILPLHPSGNSDSGCASEK